MRSMEKLRDSKQYLKLYLFLIKVFNLRRYISDKNNPPKVNIQFYDNLKNLKNINCFSNEEDKWRNSKINLDGKNKLTISLEGKFITERGRINCSLREENGFYRWLVFNL